MFKLTDEQRRAFGSAVQAASDRVEVRRAVQNLYIALRDAIDLRRPLCSASGRCCRFEEYGHRLFVTTAEMAGFVHDLGRPLPLPGASGCPFQAETLCSVHTIRPLGCRVFFCDASSTDWQREQYERFHSALKSIHNELHIPYFFVERRDALASLLSPR